MIGTLVVSYFIGGIVFLVGTILDGPDIKPRVKEYLSNRFENCANRLYPINYLRSEIVNLEQRITPLKCKVRYSVYDIVVYSKTFQDCDKCKFFLIQRAKEEIIYSMIEQLKKGNFIDWYVDDDSCSSEMTIHGKIYIDTNVENHKYYRRL